MAESQSTQESTSTNYRLPSGTTLQHCAKLGIVEDKPIMFDYWTSSCDKEILIGVRENGEKLLVKSEEEYTSPVSKIYKGNNKSFFFTKISIYVVCAIIPTKRISALFIINDLNYKL